MPSILNATTTSGLVTSADNSGSLQLQTNNGTTAVTISTGQQVQVNTAGSASAPVISKSDDTNTGIFFPAADTIAFSEGGVESMRIDSSGNLLVGSTSTPSGSGVNLQLANATATRLWLTATGTRSFYIESSTSNALQFVDGTAGAERMRITSGGEVYIAGTTDQGAYNLQCNGTGVWGAGAYVNGSDERIKDDIEPLESGLDVVAKLNPVTYKYKEDWSKDQSTQTGFIAQELLTALEGKNYVDGVVQQGGQYMSVAYQNIIPILTKAIQELKSELDTVKAELQALKGTE